MMDDRERLNEGKRLEKLSQGVYSEVFPLARGERDVMDEAIFLIGAVELDKNLRHRQPDLRMDTIAYQADIIEQLTGRQTDDAALRSMAERLGYFDDVTGISLKNLSELLKREGLFVTQQENVSLRELLETLNCGDKVLCKVNGLMMDDPRFRAFRGLIADRVIELIGLDCSDSNHIEVIYNQSTAEDGGRRCTWNVFYAAWETGNRYTLTIGWEM